MAAVAADSPWTVIKADDKKRARPNPMRHMLDSLPHANKDVARPPDMLLALIERLRIPKSS
jgi:hypothetical protein